MPMLRLSQLSALCLFAPCVFGTTSISLNQAGAQTTERASADDASIPQAIFEYVRRDEPDYSWDIVRSTQSRAGEVHQVKLVSQKWHGVTWEHALYIYEPEVIRHPTKVMLTINGGRTGKLPGEDQMAIGLQLAKLTGARIASLHQVPNQPLFDGRYEDDAITETWLKYLETGDESWPLLFPMVKSAVKAMDAIQEIARQHRTVNVDGFVLTGASKRGWTSWLTPVVDERVVGTAPMVIDMLNMRAQMQYQKKMWGRFSASIDDYTRKGLVNLGDESDRERRLRTMMDPFTYRQRLQLPKLIVLGANDPYWCTDALNLYWDDLQGNDNHILQLPNSGHGLEGNVERALRSIAMFFDSVAGGSPFPELDWKWDQQKRILNLTASPIPSSVRLWQAESVDQDFRDDRFSDRELDPLARSTNHYQALVDPVEGLHQVFFAEARYERGGVEFSQTTQVYRVD
ncbi:MAG: PhoPQ-activated protein PqaA family protein [Planctomycetota bacterium]